MFEANGKESFSDKEEKILEFWEKERVFEKSLEMRQGSPMFSFYDGPPFATGLPHYGHLLAGTIKDVIPRYKTMKGYYVPRRFGWDCHGLPVENEIEKAKQLSGAPSIEAFGIDKFNEECRGIVLRYTQEWKKIVTRMGRWVDFSRTYRTMDPSFMESVWWVFGQLFGKGLVYEGFKVMPFSAQLGTPLSNFEANLNYKEVDDPALTVLFPLVGEENTALLAWTTTPWTLPSNLAVTVGGDLDYVKVKHKESNQSYILAKARMLQVLQNVDDYEVVATFKGKDLEGKKYLPLFDYFSKKSQENTFQVLLDDYVSTEEGTGIVHTAPAFGEQDFFVCSRYGIEPVCPVDQNGKFTNEVPEFEGEFVKDADKKIIKRLKEWHRVFHHGQVRHRYPFCWRSDTPLIYKAVSTWFVAVEKIKDKMLQANEQINWVPAHIKHGRFGKWLENARDWAISRNRYWGTPIPIWRSETGEFRVFSSIEELEKKTGKKVRDLHRHFIDELTFEEDGKVFKRIPEVFDCWFESGSMPYAQNHFPFENEALTKEAFPADFIAEGLDQTRGWFYTLTVLGVALFNQPAFKNCIVNGIILAEDGTKMSKRLKNYPEPVKVIDQYGADAIRLYLMQSPAVQAEDMRFSERGVELVLRQVLIPLWNAYVFLSTYASIYKWKPEGEFVRSQADIDRWILSFLQKTNQEVTKGLDDYALDKAVEPLVTFVTQLTNWFIRRSRSRFWADDDTPDRRDAFATLYFVLFTFSKMVAPFVPFLAEELFQGLRRDEDPKSVHLCDFPAYDATHRNESLERQMASVQSVVSAGHSLRKEHKIKVRQPLGRAFVATFEEDVLQALKAQEDLIKEELNVKSIEFRNEESEFVSLVAKPNFRVLGKKVGKLMSQVQSKIQQLSSEQLNSLLGGKEITVEIGEDKLVITPEDVAVERKVHEGVVAMALEGVTVAFDTRLTHDLLLEGLARELVNKLNTMRRDADLHVSDRINVTLEATEKVQEAFSVHEEYICHEVLATQVTFGPCKEGQEWDLNGEPTRIAISKS
jgi:isoleucyl-tRNA synthetase